MKQQKKIDSYDETKRMLNTLRNFRASSFKSLNEQVEQPQPENTQTRPQINNGEEKQDFKVINNVEVIVQSSDPADLTITDEETGVISQLIDDFRVEVSELVDFGKLIFYADSAKLDGQINNINLGFMLSAGSDNGLYLTNSSLLKLSDETTIILEKLKKFQYKFSSTIDDLISNRKQN